MPNEQRRAGLDIVVKVADGDGHTRGRFLISARSLYYFRRNTREPARRYSWRQLIDMIEAETAQKKAASKGRAKRGSSKKA